MNQPVRTFEHGVLRPLQLVTLILVFLLALRFFWPWVVAAIAAFFYLGLIGSKLHPLQSARELASGPLNGPAANREAAILDPQQQTILVGHACTRVGLLLGVAAGAACWFALGWRWWAALLVAWLVILLAGAGLKLAFKVVVVGARLP